MCHSAVPMQRFSPYATLHDHAFRRAGVDAIVCDGARISYEEFLERVMGSANWLLQHGLASDEPTGISIRDEVEHLVTAMALLLLATPQISLGAHESGPTKRALAEKVGVKQLIVDKVEAWMEGLRAIAVPESGFSTVQGGAKDIFRAQPVDSVAIYQSTSGSTRTIDEPNTLIPKGLSTDCVRFMVTVSLFHIGYIGLHRAANGARD